MEDKKNILIIGPYLPGKSFGGPVKSIYNMVEMLDEYYNFHIITGDRDLNAKQPYKDVDIDSWNKVGKADVYYVPKGKMKRYVKLSKDKKYDLVYTSSFFSKASILIQILKSLKVIKVPVVVAPRGEFSSGALNLKSDKKRMFLKFYKVINLHKNLTYTCTTNTDKKDIKFMVGYNDNVISAGNIVNNESDFNSSERKKSAGELKIVTVSRVSRIKNIDYSLKVLKKLAESDTTLNNILFDIYGPIEDKEYMEECLAIAKNIDKRIKVNFMGPIDYSSVIKTLSSYHVFLFPTKGENFGHVIQEALLAGCPVVISDQTPWRKLNELNVGYDISLNKNDEFIDAIMYYLNMSGAGFQQVSNKSHEYGLYNVENQASIDEHIEMFNGLIDG